MIKVCSESDVFRTVLFIEDSDDDFESAHDVLNSFDDFYCPVVRAENCSEALGYLDNADSDPCLILLDLNLPGKHGSEFLKKLKNDCSRRHIPIVIFSCSDEMSDVNACYANGANSFVRKPGTLEELDSVLRSLKKFWFQTSTVPHLIK